MSAINNLIIEDYDLTAEQLDDKYNPDGGGEHPIITRADWRQAVESEDTLTGYWEWVEHQIFEVVFEMVND